MKVKQWRLQLELYSFKNDIKKFFTKLENSFTLPDDYFCDSYFYVSTWLGYGVQLFGQILV